MTKTQTRQSSEAAQAVEAIAAAMQTIRSAANDLRAQIVAKESERDALAQQILEIQTLPVCFDDWLKSLRNFVDACGQEAAPSGDILTPKLGELAAVPFNQRKPGDIGGGKFFFHGVRGKDPVQGAENPFFTLCFYFPEQVFEKLSAHYREVVGGRWGNEDHPRLDARSATVAGLRAQIAALNGEMEGLRAELKTLENATDPASVEAPMTGEPEPLGEPALAERKLRF